MFEVSIDRARTVALLSVALLVSVACGVGAQPTPSATGAATATPQGTSAADAKWAALVAAAEAEGQLNLVTPPGDLYRTAIAAFQTRFPKIKVNQVGSNGSQIAPQISTERKNNQFNWDVYVGGATSLQRILKPEGALIPLKPELILPEVVDESKWNGGFQDAYLDKELQYIFGFEFSVSQPGVVNLSCFPNQADAPKSLDDLLDPKWSGKFVMIDPRGQGINLFAVVLFELGQANGVAWETKLLQNKPVIFESDLRSGAERIIRCQSPISVGVSEPQLIPFITAGVPFNAKVLDMPKGVRQYVSSGSGSIALLKDAPHPAAAKVFLNWQLSQEGQTNWTKIIGEHSRRFDVPAGRDATRKAVEGSKYLSSQKEDLIELQTIGQNTAKQILGQ